jgi:cytochrome c556
MLLALANYSEDMMKFRIKAVIAVVVMAFGASLAGAAGDPIETRRGLMKSVGKAYATSRRMIRGKIPYDPLKAELAARTINAAMTGIGNFYPDGSQTGKTRASPKIWSDRKGYTALREELVAASAGAIVAAKKGSAAFKTAFEKVNPMCNKCHKAYRTGKL